MIGHTAVLKGPDPPVVGEGNTSTGVTSHREIEVVKLTRQERVSIHWKKKEVSVGEKGPMGL